MIVKWLPSMLPILNLNALEDIFHQAHMTMIFIKRKNNLPKVHTYFFTKRKEQILFKLS